MRVDGKSEFPYQFPHLTLCITIRSNKLLFTWKEINIERLENHSILQSLNYNYIFDRMQLWA